MKPHTTTPPLRQTTLHMSPYLLPTTHYMRPSPYHYYTYCGDQITTPFTITTPIISRMCRSCLRVVNQAAPQWANTNRQSAPQQLPASQGNTP